MVKIYLFVYLLIYLFISNGSTNVDDEKFPFHLRTPSASPLPGNYYEWTICVLPGLSTAY